KQATVIRDEVEIAVLHESVQLYDPDEFGDLLRAGGLEVERLFGDFSGVALGPAEPRMIAVGHRA
ncbi:MAG: hypothetical protein HY706_14210, partial [Candidatus Hydrogenedentes bacterium]|nr:hypothetical protein [Candidatus Hydrogenedentota bacterium]